jgi:hypothetical protein
MKLSSLDFSLKLRPNPVTLVLLAKDAEVVVGLLLLLVAVVAGRLVVAVVVGQAGIALWPML